MQKGKALEEETKTLKCNLQELSSLNVSMSEEVVGLKSLIDKYESKEVSSDNSKSQMEDNNPISRQSSIDLRGVQLRPRTQRHRSLYKRVSRKSCLHKKNQSTLLPGTTIHSTPTICFGSQSSFCNDIITFRHEEIGEEEHQRFSNEYKYESLPEIILDETDNQVELETSDDQLLSSSHFLSPKSSPIRRRNLDVIRKLSNLQLEEEPACESTRLKTEDTPPHFASNKMNENTDVSREVYKYVDTRIDHIDKASSKDLLLIPLLGGISLFFRFIDQGANIRINFPFSLFGRNKSRKTNFNLRAS